MDIIVDNTNITQSNTNSVYSSVVVSDQQQNHVPNNNIIAGEVIEVFTEERRSKPIIKSGSSVIPINSSKNYSVSNQTIPYIKINGKLIKEKERWCITDERNNDCYETGQLNEYNNRSGLSYVYVNDELREIHEYKNDRRVGNYKIFDDGKLFEYNDKNKLIYEGDYSVSLFNNYYRSGYGKEYKEGRLYFEGEWKNNYPNGEGTLYSINGGICKVGQWDNGYLHDDKGYYNYKTKDYLNGGCVKFFICFSFIIGLLLLFIFMVFKYDDPSYFACGLLLVLLSICQQFSFSICSLLILLIIIIFDIFVILIPTEFESPFFIFIIGVFYSVTILAVVCSQHQTPYPSYYTVLFPFIYQKEWEIYIMELIITFLPLFQYCFILFFIDEEDISSCWLMPVNFFVNLIILYLHVCNNCFFKVGVLIGYIWGVLSFILCCVCIFVFINHAPFAWMLLVFQYVIMSFYSWLAFIASYSIKKSKC